MYFIMYGNNFTVCFTNEISEYIENIQMGFRTDSSNVVVPFDEKAIKQFYLKKSGYNEALNMDTYLASCDIKKRISGFTDTGVAFNNYYTKRTFNCFYLKHSNLFLLQSDIQSGKTYLKQYSKHRNLKKPLTPIEIDFSKVEANAIIQGCSAKAFNDANIHSRQITGEDLFNHPEYKQMKKDGKITSLTIEYVYNKNEYLVLISGKGSIWIRKPDTDIITAINIASKICDDILL